MALDKPALAASLAAAFQQGMGDPAWTQADAAQALADAIDAYVRGAEVTGITVDVADLGGQPLGTGAQAAPGALS